MRAEIIVRNNPAWGFPTGSDIDVGLNGRAYRIQEGKRVSVPVGVLENLEHAVVVLPKTDSTGQLMFDENGKQVYEKHERYIVQVLKDPRLKGAKPRQNNTQLQKSLDKIDEAELLDDDNINLDMPDVEEVEAKSKEEKKGIMDKIFKKD